MAKKEVAAQYVGTLLGFIWTFIQPMVMIFVFWVVFSVGFKVQPTNNVPFVVWLTAGMAIWFVFAEIVNGSSTVIVTNASLIKKTRFHSHILPVVKIIAALITHLIFLCVLFALIVFQNMPFSLYYFQFLYYLIAMIVFCMGLGWAFSALNVFVRDIGQIVSVVLQIGFWATPIFWDIQIMPERIQTVFKLNPMFYIVQGYRDSFIYFRPFWEHPYLTIYFWIVASATLLCGALIFRKLKPDFADIL
jgi:lipopolysaccharide transport system permease protein/teichoic acid transport system permease protein